MRILLPKRSVRPETRFRYDQLVAGGVVDRKEWAKFVQELLDEEAAPREPGGRQRVHGAKTRFAEKAGLKSARTVDTWLAEQVDVKESSVRAAAVAYGRNPVEVLISMGVYARDEMPAPVIPPEDEWIVALVAKYDFSPDKQKQLTALLLEQTRREREEARRRIEEQLTLLGGNSDDEINE